MFNLAAATQMLRVVSDIVNKFAQEIGQRHSPALSDKRAIDPISLCAPFVFDSHRAVQHGHGFGFSQPTKKAAREGAIEGGDRNCILELGATIRSPQFK